MNQEIIMMIKRYLLTVVLTLLSVMSISATAIARVADSDEAEVRSAVRRTFDNLKSKNYGALYDSLPSASKARINRESFTSGLRRSQDMYELERIEVGAVRVSGDIAVADITMYGRTLRPVEAEGKIVAQQYLVKEEGKWRVLAGDNATIRRLISAYPSFAKKYPVRNPRVYVKRDGRWVDVNSLKTKRTSE
jgi:hypothetical protein